MVDAEDLKSFGHCDRVGSSPTIPTTDIKPIFCRFFIVCIVFCDIICVYSENMYRDE